MRSPTRKQRRWNARAVLEADGPVRACGAAGSEGPELISSCMISSPISFGRAFRWLRKRAMFLESGRWKDSRAHGTCQRSILWLRCVRGHEEPE